MPFRRVFAVAHVGAEPVYRSNRAELTALMGGAAYAELVLRCEAHLDTVKRARSAGARQLIPLLVHPATGEASEQVTVVAPGEDMQALLVAVDFQVGTTYLVSATGDQVSLCGFTAEKSPELEAMYAEAFGA